MFKVVVAKIVTTSFSQLITDYSKLVKSQDSVFNIFLCYTNYGISVTYTICEGPKLDA